MKNKILSGIGKFYLTGFLFWGLIALPHSAEGGLAGGASENPDMILIPAGEFIFGSSQKDVDWVVKKFFSESRDWYQDETPAQHIYLDEFYIDRTEVTVSAYKKYTGETGKNAPKFFDKPRFNQDDQPVVGVNWQEAADYCQWAGKRLPSEVEWEKAARGTDARIYPWGNSIDKTKANVRGMDDKFRYPAPVGKFSIGKSPYGVLDMAGNVWEWTDSWYRPYPGNDKKNDLYGKKFKVMKGGSWFSNMDLARNAVRGKGLPAQKQNYIGFRCARGANK